MTTLTRRQLFAPWRLFQSLPDLPPSPASELLRPFLRPPGALEEPQFLQSCERCHRCMEACPPGAIRLLSPAYGDKFDTPAILPRDEACRLCDDLHCAQACPSGALRPLPIAEVKMGHANLNADQCWSVQGQPCDYCVSACPLPTKALALENGLPAIDLERCVGCGLCEYMCTATPSAIEVRPGPRGDVEGVLAFGFRP